MRIRAPHILHVAAATIQGWRLFHLELLIVRLLFEGGDYSRAPSNRSNTQTVESAYIQSDYILVHGMVHLSLLHEWNFGTPTDFPPATPLSSHTVEPKWIFMFKIIATFTECATVIRNTNTHITNKYKAGEGVSCYSQSINKMTSSFSLEEKALLKPSSTFKGGSKVSGNPSGYMQYLSLCIFTCALCIFCN